MPISAIGGTASSVLMEKAQSTQNKTNKLEQVSVPLEDGATQQLGARDMAAIAKAVMTKATSPGETSFATAATATTSKLDIKA